MQGMNIYGETPHEVIQRLQRQKAELLSTLEWIAHEAGQYGDGAEDSSWAARFLLEVEQKAKEAIRKATG